MVWAGLQESFWDDFQGQDAAGVERGLEQNVEQQFLCPVPPAPFVGAAHHQRDRALFGSKGGASSQERAKKEGPQLAEESSPLRPFLCSQD
jgi:hypothetical protein